VTSLGKDLDNSNKIFVFGSNLKGIHGKGAALTARNSYGAQLGVGEGRTGNSYALPTKSTPSSSLHPNRIKAHVDTFINYAKQNPDLTFLVTRVGCGLAGFRDELIAPFFLGSPSNCVFDIKWLPWLGESRNYFEAIYS